MAYMLVQSVVEDFDAWKESFDDYTGEREDHGVRTHEIFRSTTNPNQLVILEEFDSEENARRWVDYLEGKQDPMEERIDRSEITYLELIERRSTETPVT